jgi:hypothetical protein
MRVIQYELSSSDLERYSNFPCLCKKPEISLPTRSRRLWPLAKGPAIRIILRPLWHQGHKEQRYFAGQTSHAQCVYSIAARNHIALQFVVRYELIMWHGYDFRGAVGDGIHHFGKNRFEG